MANYNAFLRTARQRFKDTLDYWHENREKAEEDLNFLNGENQWPQGLKGARDVDERPTLTINKLPQYVDQVMGDQRMNRPRIKVKPVDSQADPDTAEVMTGLIRNIENISDAEIAYDTAFECMVGGGMGYFRIITEYSDDDVFEQDILIKRINNPFTVHIDPNAQEYDCSDARFAFISAQISREEFRARYPKKRPSEFSDAQGDEEDWVQEDNIRIAEYFWKEKVMKTLYLLADGTVTDEIMEGIEVMDERQVETYKVRWCIMDGTQILEGPQDWPGKYIPIVPVWGKEINVKGKRSLRGLIRFAKDPQRLYNFYRSAGAEIVAAMPKAPFMLTPKQIDGHQSQWNQSHKRNFPYLLYNVDQEAPPPTRQMPNVQNTGITEQVQLADQELNDTTSIQFAGLGKPSNEKSGRAILARQREGDVASFAYVDNLARSIRYAGKIILDLIPHIYTDARVIRVLGEDGTEDFVPVNQPHQDQETGSWKLHDLTAGKYDVVVTVGPSFTTQRDEAAESMMAFLNAVPQAAPIISDLIARNMDWPHADEIAERLVPPEFRKEDPNAPQQPPPPPDPLVELKIAQEQEELTKLKLQNEKIKQEIMNLMEERENAEVERSRAYTA